MTTGSWASALNTLQCTPPTGGHLKPTQQHSFIQSNVHAPIFSISQSPHIVSLVDWSWYMFHDYVAHCSGGQFHSGDQEPYEHHCQSCHHLLYLCYKGKLTFDTTFLFSLSLSLSVFTFYVLMKTHRSRPCNDECLTRPKAGFLSQRLWNLPCWQHPLSITVL